MYSNDNDFLDVEKSGICNIQSDIISLNNHFSNQEATAYAFLSVR